MLTQRVELWAGRTEFPQRVEAVRGDSARTLECVLMDVSPPEGATARFFARKPSGAQIYNECAISGNTVSVRLTSQTLAEAGTVPCQVELRKGDMRLTSFAFALEVREGLATDEALESFDETDVLQGLVDEMRGLVDEMGKRLPDLEPGRALASDGAGNVSASDVTGAELGCLDDARGNIQKQIDDLSAIDNSIKQQIQALETSVGENSGIQDQIEALKSADEAIREQLEGLSGGAGGGEYASKKIYGDTSIQFGLQGSVNQSSVGAISYGGLVAATELYSQAFGEATTASGRGSHAEGYGTKAIGDYSHAEGNTTVANGLRSHAEGISTKTGSDSLHGDAAHAEGSNTVADGNDSHAEGCHTQTISRAQYSHAEGYYSEARGEASHAEGCYTTAGAEGAHAEGYHTRAANRGCHAEGCFNVGVSGADFNITEVGYGSSDSARQNVMSIQASTGNMKVKGSVTGSTTADYAEFFEWADGNPDGEDRVGLFVTLEGERIRVAGPSDGYVLGAVSGAPFVVGNGDCDVWNGMLLRDEFGRIVREEREVPVMEADPETGEERQAMGDGGEPLTRTESAEAINPDYDPSRPYVPRLDRKEWSPVGMLGVLRVRQDGTCRADGYCRCGDGGVATACAEGDSGAYRVIAIVSDKVAKAIIR